MQTSKCGCPDFTTPCGVVKCPKTCANSGSNPCGCSQSACSNIYQPAYVSSGTCNCGQPANLGPSICDCGIPACSCYRDTSNVCYVCDKPSPTCSCLKAANSDCGCKCEDMRSFIYFPEVEYPVMALDMKPYYYGGCYTY